MEAQGVEFSMLEHGKVCQSMRPQVQKGQEEGECEGTIADVEPMGH